MKLTAAEYKVLDALHCVQGGKMPLDWLRSRKIAKQLRYKKLISSRDYDNGIVSATALGKRAHSYGRK